MLFVLTLLQSGASCYLEKELQARLTFLASWIEHIGSWKNDIIEGFKEFRPHFSRCDFIISIKFYRWKKTVKNTCNQVGSIFRNAFTSKEVSLVEMVFSFENKIQILKNVRSDMIFYK